MGKTVALKHTIFWMEPPTAFLICCLWCKIVHSKRNASVGLAIPVGEIWLIRGTVPGIDLLDVHITSPLLSVV